MEKDNKKIKKMEGKVGVIVSAKMDKTVVVKVDTLKTHSKYKKKYKVSKKYKAHDETNKFKEGDEVMILESKPISKEKRWVAKEIKINKV